MSARIYRFPVRHPEHDPDPPSSPAPCWSCGGRRYTEVWQPGCRSGGGVRCVTCDGVGAEPAHPSRNAPDAAQRAPSQQRDSIPCSHCHGTGDVLTAHRAFPADSPFEPCFRCNGTGEILGPPAPVCSTCAGVGSLWVWDNDGPFQEPCDDCGGYCDASTAAGEDLIVEVLRWHLGEIVVSSANRMAEFAAMIDRRHIPELDPCRQRVETVLVAA